MVEQPEMSVGQKRDQVEKLPFDPERQAYLDRRMEDDNPHPDEWLQRIDEQVQK